MNSLIVIQAAITIINGLIVIGNNSAKFRALVAKAVAEGRNISAEEIKELEQSAIDSIRNARDND